jgi:hypothetical protein
VTDAALRSNVHKPRWNGQAYLCVTLPLTTAGSLAILLILCAMYLTDNPYFLPYIEAIADIGIAGLCLAGDDPV